MHHIPHVFISVKGLIFLSFLAFLVVGQIFWVIKARRWKERVLRNATLKRVLDVLGLVAYVAYFIYGFGALRYKPSPTRLTLSAALLQGPLLWWIFGSTVGFALYILVRAGWMMARLGGRWLAARPDGHGQRPNFKSRIAESSDITPPGREQNQISTFPNAQPIAADPPAPLSRREFFATAFGAVPFVAGAYGFLYERVDVETTTQRIVLPHLPRAFEGFRILQLSDLHIGPFMSGRKIRKVVEMANRLKPDLIALTGDYVTWDASTQYAVVDALSELRAPHGVLGCLGNHEIYTHTQASITRLFASRGFRILRQEQALVEEGQDALNVIGVDYESRERFGRFTAGYVTTYLTGVDRLMRPGAVNILLSHNPNTFDRAAELGIDLSLAGHTHGGQISLELASVNISPARLVTPYVRGWFHRRSGQLYVNRGIGTIALPIRLGAPPEITVYQLTRRT